MNKIKLITLMLSLSVILGGCTENGQRSIPESQSQPPTSNLAPEPPKPTNTTVSMVAVGDNLIHDNIFLQAQKRAGGIGYDFTLSYDDISKDIEKADIAIINQETPLASRIAPPSNYPLFNSPIEVGEHMLDIGFDVFNHANNHIYDKGEAGVIATMEFWGENPEAIVTGVYTKPEDKDIISTITKNDITFSYLGYAEHTNGLNMPVGSPISVILTSEVDTIKSQIESAQKISDVVVVSVHWGNENTHQITPNQKSLANDMINWGADIIIGTHPHVLQPIDYITRADGTKGLVIYSLGNFISSQLQAPNLIGGMVNLNITKNYNDNSITISDVILTPIVTHYDYGRTNIRLYKLENYNNQLSSVHNVKSNYPQFSMEYINEVVNSVIDLEYLN